MATRFGGASTSYALVVKMRWIVGALLAVVLLLVVLLFWVLRQRGEAPGETAGQVAPLPTPNESSPQVEIIVAAQRIEDGARLSRELLTIKPWNPDALPDNALLAREMEAVQGRWAKGVINANLPILRDQLSESQPLSSLNIPPGFRATTITVDARTGVEGFAKPNSRVDVLFTYTDRDNKRQVSTLCRFIKVLSVAGLTQTAEGRVNVAGAVNVTLLVTERDAKRIELARTYGSLTLALVGGEEPGVKRAEEGEPIDFGDLIPSAPEERRAEEPSEGSMYMTDPKTGKRCKYSLRSGRWSKDPECN